MQSHVPDHSSAKTGPHQKKLLSYFLQRALSLGSYLQEERCVWHGETLISTSKTAEWCIYPASLYILKKLLTIIFTLKYTLQIRKAELKMALNRKPLYNHGQPSERGNNKVLFKTASPLYMIKGLQKYCSDLHLNLLITCSFSLPSQRSNL